MDRRSDGGLQGAQDRNAVERVNFQSSHQVTASDQLELRLGQLLINAGTGIAGNVDNPIRDTGYVSQHLQVDWKRALSDDADVTLRFVHSEESYNDRFAYSLLPWDWRISRGLTSRERP